MTFQQVLETYKYQLILVLIFLSFVYARIVGAMAGVWVSDDNYSHGFIVPLVAAWFIYDNWDGIKTSRADGSNLGLPVLLLGIVQLLLGWMATEYYNMRLSLIVVLSGIILYLFGREVFRKLKLSLAYLILMIPLPYIVYDAVAFPLKLFVSWCSVHIIKLMGYAVLREGNIISFPNIVLEVADACSGLRSLVSLIALSVTFAVIFLKGNFSRWLLVFSSVPVAVATNIFRVVVTGILAFHYGRSAAEGFFHEFAGMVIFFIAMILLSLICGLLKYMESRYAA